MLRYSLLLVFSFVLAGNSAFSQKSKNEFVITFGSCNRESLPQPLWEDVVNEKPDLWIWLGDNIYGDSNDTTVLRAKYQKMLDHPGYQKVMQQTAIIGTWDDHDYGKNDGNKTFEIKKESQKLALDFLNEPLESPRRKQEGIYASYDYKFGNKKIKVILLDVRYHMDVLKRERAGYFPDSAADILGAEQWKWLEKELRTSKADVNIIGSGLQFIPMEHRTEKWGNFPTSLERFYNLVADSKAKGVMLITGDRHIGEFSRIDVPGMKYPLYEFTSSGLTHVTGPNVPNPNQYRVGPLINKKHYGVFRFTTQNGKVNVEASLKGEGGENLITHSVQYP